MKKSVEPVSAAKLFTITPKGRMIVDKANI